MANQGPKGTPNFDTRLVFVIGICATLMFITIIFAIWAGFEYVWNAEVYIKQYEPPYQELVQIEAEQEAQLRGTEPGTISIEAAMERVAKQ